MSEDVQDKDDQWIQKVILQPKGVMLWSKRTIRLFHDRSKEDIVYLDATGSIVKKAKGESTPFYIYELVVRNPVKGCSPVPVATYVTCEHTTASITYFLGSFITDCVKQHGPKIRRRPVMLLCDGSVVLMQAMAHNLCGLSLNELLSQYYQIVTGQGKEHALALPILHRCLSHVMKNAKDLCKKHAAKHYRLCMHVFGLMTQATTLKELDQVVVSVTVLLASPCSGENVEKYFKDLQTLLTAVAQPVIDDSGIAEEDFVNDLGPTPFDFKDVIQQASLDKVGEPNEYFCPNFIPKLLKYFLPQAALWSKLLLGDLGRHGRGPFYEKLSKRFKTVAQKSTQNYTKDNMTQGIMEKSQWDLKKIRFQQKRLTRLDDLVHTYKVMHNALLREYQDSLKTKNKTHRVDVERWKQRRRGVYVTPITKPFEFKKSKAKKVMKKILNPSLSTSNLKEAQEKHRDSFPQHTPSQLKSPHQSTSVITDAHEQKPSPEHVTSQLTSMWKRKDIEVVVAVLPSHIRGNPFLIHHSELPTLRPHQWLTGEVIEGLFQLSVFLVDPAANSKEKEDSENAAKRVREYFKMRRTCYGKEDWGTVKWRGATMHHPVQRDGSSCGVIVTMMARAVMEAFPALPIMSFGTSKKEMALFHMENNCAMCSASKPPGSGPPTTDWIQCDTCERWFHEQCLGMNQDQLQEARYSILDVAVGRQALYARGLQVLWRCFQLLARQLRLRHAAEQKVETLKGEVALWKRKADEALQRLENELTRGENMSVKEGEMDDTSQDDREISNAQPQSEIDTEESDQQSTETATKMTTKMNRKGQTGKDKKGPEKDKKRKRNKRKTGTEPVGKDEDKSGEEKQSYSAPTGEEDEDTSQDDREISNAQPQSEIDTEEYLATGDSYRTIAFSYRVGHATVAVIVKEVAGAIWTALVEETMPVPQLEDWRAIAAEFQERWNFPNCVGAIDGKHGVIQAPANSGSLYFNYKSSHSLVLLAVVDAQYLFRIVDVGGFGKSSDSGSLRNSAFGESLRNGSLQLPPDTLFGVLVREDGQQIMWKYIEELHKLQEKEGLRLGNKLKMAHIQWRNQKMKVNLAAQLFSSSVADALEYSEKALKYPQFTGSAATVQFLRTIDAAFDVLNSRNPLGTGHKAPIKPATKHRAI
ncbi:hypothetical protein JOQ06_027806, partial [Pogonophryne albipinna]